MRINATAATASVVAGAAFLASAQHIYSVAHEAGNPAFIAAVHAIGIDGLILIGINALSTARAAAIISIAYGAIVSLIFNAASYGAFEMHPLALAVTMPVALVLAYVTMHASQRPKDTGDKATETEVDVHVRRRTVPAPRPTVQATAVPAYRPVPATVVPAEVVPAERPAIERAERPASSRGWSGPEREAAEALISAGGKSDWIMAREVFGPDATEAHKKKIERLRRSLSVTN
jgi:hypothetical protein